MSAEVPNVNDEEMNTGLIPAFPRNVRLEDTPVDRHGPVMTMYRANGEARGRFPQEMLYGGTYQDGAALLRDVWKGWMGENSKGTKHFLREVVLNSTNILRLFPLMLKEELMKHPRYAYLNNRVYSQNITMAPGVMEEASAKAPAMDVDEDVELREQNFGPLFKDNYRAPMDYPFNKASADRLTQRSELSAKCASMTWEHQAVKALAETGRKELYDAMVRRGAVRQHMDALRRYIKFVNGRKFALMKNGTGFFGILTRAVSDMSSESRPTDAMFPHGTSRGLMMNADALDFRNAGSRAETTAQGAYGDTAPSNLAYMGTTLYNIRVSEVMPFRSKLGADMKHPLERTTYTSQFFLMSGRQSEAPAPHRAIRDITVHNMNSSTEATLTFEEAMFNSSAYEPDSSAAVTPGGRALWRLLTKGANGVRSISYQQSRNQYDDSHTSIDKENEENGVDDAPWRTPDERMKAAQEKDFARLFSGDKPDTEYSFKDSDDMADTKLLEAELRVSPVDGMGLGVNLYNLLISAGDGSTRVLDLMEQQLLAKPDALRDLVKLFETKRNGVDANSAQRFTAATHAIEQNDRFRAAQTRPNGRVYRSMTEVIAQRLATAAPLPTATAAHAAQASTTTKQPRARASLVAAPETHAALSTFRSLLVNVPASEREAGNIDLINATAVVPRVNASLQAAFNAFSKIVKELTKALREVRNLNLTDWFGALNFDPSILTLLPGANITILAAAVRGSASLDLLRQALVGFLLQNNAGARAVAGSASYENIKKTLGDRLDFVSLTDAVRNISSDLQVDPYPLPVNLVNAFKALAASEHVAAFQQEANIEHTSKAVKALLQRLSVDGFITASTVYEIAIYASYLADLNTRSIVSSLTNEAATLAQLVELDDGVQRSDEQEKQRRSAELLLWINSHLRVAVSGNRETMYKNIIRFLGGENGGEVPAERCAPYLKNLSSLAAEFIQRNMEGAYPDQITKNKLRALFLELLYTRTSTNPDFIRLVIEIRHKHGDFSNIKNEELIRVAESVLTDPTHDKVNQSLQEFQAAERNRNGAVRVAGGADSGHLRRRQAIDYVTRDPYQIRRLLMRTRLTMDMWRLLERHGLTLPASFIIVRPWVEIIAVSAMLFKAGAETGVMTVSNASVAYAEELHPMEIEIQVQFNANLLIHEPANISFLPDVFPSKYIQGGGVRYNNLRDNASIFFSNTVERADLLALLVPYPYIPAEAFVPINGLMDPKVTIIDNAQEAYPTAPIYRNIWNMDPYRNDNLNDNMHSFVGWGRKAPTFEWRCDRGFYRYTAFSVTKNLCEERDVLGEDSLGRNPSVGDVGFFGHASEYHGTGMVPLGGIRRNAQV